MNRQPQPGYCGKVPDLRTHDIVVMPDGMVIVAAGNEGFVIRQPGGDWQRVGIDDYINATPIRARNLGEAIGAFTREFIYAGALSLLVYSLLSIWARRSTPRPMWALHPGWFVLPWLLAGTAVVLTVREHSLPGGGFMLTPIIFFAALVALVIMLLTMGLYIFAEPAGAQRRADKWAFIAVFSATGIPMLVFLLWAYGAIPPYWLAAVLAVILTAIGVVLAVGRWRAAQAAVKESDPAGG